MYRYKYVDALKAFGIVLAIIGHCDCPAIVKAIIYSFHMPLFFTISGYLFSEDKLNISIIQYIVKKAKSLLWPYFLFALITFLFYSIWQYLGKGLTKSFLYKQVTALVYSNYIWERNYTGTIWFLTALFMTEVIWFIIRKCCTRKGTFFLCTILGICGLFYSDFIPFRLPLGTDVALTALIFYEAGYCLRYGKMTLTYYQQGVILSFMGVLIGFLNCILSNLEKVDMLYLLYGNRLLFCLSALFTITGLLILFKCYNKFDSPHLKLILYIGKNSLIIMSVHVMILDILKQFVRLMWGEYIKGLFWPVVAGVCLCISLLLTMYINKFFYQIFFLKKKG